MYGNNNLSIGISLILRDQFSGKMEKARRELDLTTAAGQKAERASLQAQRNMLAAGTVAGITALGVAREWVKVGANFDKQMTYAYSITDKTSGAGIQTLDRLKKKAMEVGKDTMFSSTQVAGAMTTMAQAGQSYDQMMNNINATAVLAAASMSDIEQSSSAMNDIMIGFDIEATEKNSMRVADIITRTINDSNIRLDSYAETMKYVIPTAKTLGVTLEEVSAITSVLGNAGLKGSMAGTGTENMIRLLAIAAGKEEGTKEYSALASMGLGPKDLTDARGNLKPIQEILQMLGKGLSGLPNVQRTKIITDLLNIRGGRPGQLLTFAKGLENFGEALNNINNSGGIAQQTADDVMGTLWGNMERLESTWETFKISFTEAIEPVLVPALTLITQLLDAVVGFINKPYGKVIAVAAGVLITLRTGIMAYRTILLTLRLAQNQFGAAAVSSTMRGAQGYNRLTNTINQTTIATERLARATMIKNRVMAGEGVGMGRATWNANRKQWTSNNWGVGRDKATIQRMESRYGRSMRAGRIMNRFGGVGGLSTIGMIGGMGLSAAADQFDEGSAANRGLDLAGSALSGAGTGAMIGSVIPGVGTAVGALVGGVGSVLWTLYNQVEAEKERVKSASDEAKSQEGQYVAIEAHQWAKQAKAILEQRSRAYAYMGNYEQTPEGLAAHQQHYAPDYLGMNKNNNQNTKVQNRITINLDGTQAFNKVIEDSNYNTNVNYSF